jgi:hypothetical protein
MKKENQNIPTMDATKVKIENWPKDTCIKTWIPITIAIISIIVSLVSLNYTRKDFIRSSRPYVWAINAFDLDYKVNRPEIIVFRVSNSPAIIKMVKMEIYSVETNSKKLLYESNPEGSYARYPDEKANWNLRMSPEKWTEILTNYTHHGSLERHITINYSNLDENLNYYYKMTQKYEPNGSDWLDIDVQAN